MWSGGHCRQGEAAPCVEHFSAAERQSVRGNARERAGRSGRGFEVEEFLSPPGRRSAGGLRLLPHPQAGCLDARRTCMPFRRRNPEKEKVGECPRPFGRRSNKRTWAFPYLLAGELAACQTWRASPTQWRTGNIPNLSFPGLHYADSALTTEHPTNIQAGASGRVVEHQRLPHTRKANLDNV